MSLNELLILSGMDAVLVLLIVLKFFSKKITTYWKVALPFIPSFLLIEASKLIIPEYVSTILLYVNVILFIMLILRKRFLIAVAVAAFSSFIAVAVQYMLSFILGLFVELEFTFAYGFAVVFASVIIGIALYLYAPLFTVIQILEKKAEQLAFITFISTSSLFFMHAARFSSPENVSHFKNYGIFFFSILMVFLCYHLIKVAILKMEARILKTYIIAFEQMILDKTTEWSKTDKNIIPVHSLAEAEANEETKNKILAFLDDLDGGTNLMDIGRIALHPFLYVKLNELREMGVNCKIKITDYQLNHKIEDHKIAEVLSILLDNAAEATTVRDNEIQLNIIRYEEHKRTLIEVLNKHKPLDWNNMFEEMQERSFIYKDGKKGKGIYNLNNMSKEYDFTFFYDDRKIDGESYVCFGILL